MPTFVEADRDYRAAIEAPGRELADAFASAHAAGPVNLKDTDLTHAVLLRLKSYFAAQDEIKRSLQKVYAAPAADFFVETVCFFLKVAFRHLNPSLVVASEKNIVPRRGALRPDISIWQADKVVSAIECKTQLGWNRNKWLPDFEEREKRLHQEYPEAKLFLLVLTSSNWRGFGTDQRGGKQFFVLLGDAGVGRIRDLDLAAPNMIIHRIEALIQEIHLHTGGKPGVLQRISP